MRSSSISSRSGFHRRPSGETGRSGRDWVWKFQHHGETQTESLFWCTNQYTKISSFMRNGLRFMSTRTKNYTEAAPLWSVCCCPTQTNLASPLFAFLKELHNVFQTLQRHPLLHFQTASWDKTFYIFLFWMTVDTGHWTLNLLGSWPTAIIW